MLIEAPPYYLVDGVSILRDHEDPRQFYYQPLAPRFVTRRDGAVDVPQFSLLQFKSATAANNGGFADFDVHLGLTPDELERVRQGLASLAGVADPILSPVPVVDGSISLLLFGTQSGGTPGDGTGFVTAIRHAAKPSLYGDNRAAFSVRLDQPGVTVLRQAMNLEMSPIAVVYSLDYLALRPAYHVKLEIDWDRTQDILDTSFGHESLFTDIQIQDVMEKLVEKRAIVFDTDTFVPEDDTSTVLERRNAAVARARDMITDAFFTSSVDPLRQAPDDWDKVRDVVKSFAPQRFSPLGVFSYRRTHYSRIDRKRLDVDFSERVTIKRTMYPQGHLSGLFRLLGRGFDLGRLITEVNADDPWFQRRKLTVVSLARQPSDPAVRSVTASMTYAGDTQVVRLDSARTSGTVEWPSTIVGGDMVMPIDLSYTVDLFPVDGGERPQQLRSQPEQVLGLEHGVEPRALFSEEVIPILTLPGFPFTRYPRVDVRLRYTDPANDVRQDDIVQVNADKTSGEWTRFLVGSPAEPVQVKLTYRGADGRTHETPFTALDGPQVDVPDPFPQRLVVKIISALGTDVERAFVDITFEDPDHGQRVSTSAEVVPGQPTEPFVVDRVDPSATLLRYKITLLMKDTSLIELPTSTTMVPRIFVRADLRGHRVVQVRSPANFAAAGLERIEVEARAVDEAAGLSVTDRFEFTAAGAASLFEFDFVDPTHDTYELRVRRLFRNGLSEQQEWRRFDADVVTLPATT
jgi:hypothetical protein